MVCGVWAEAVPKTEKSANRAILEKRILEVSFGTKLIYCSPGAAFDDLWATVVVLAFAKIINGGRRIIVLPIEPVII